METTKSLSKTDRAALQLAIDLSLADPLRTEQVESKLRDDGWLETAMFCSYVCQCETLSLCSETAPCDIADPAAALKGPNDEPWYYGAHQAAQLVIRMRALGISRFHPDPPAALEAASKGK